VSTAPHLDTLLSLDHTHTFTFVDVPNDEEETYIREVLDDLKIGKLFRQRSSQAGPIRIHKLAARFVRPTLGSDAAPSTWYIEQVLACFDPVHVSLSSFSALPAGEGFNPDDDEPLYVSLPGREWTRLNSLSISELSWPGFLSSEKFLARLSAASLTVICDLAGPANPTGMIEDLASDLSAHSGDELLSPSWPQVKELVIRVKSEEDKDRVGNEIRESWDGDDLNQQERDRREGMIRYIVV
jgi:hypothetical protein